jgi:hypothetical protein
MRVPSGILTVSKLKAQILDAFVGGWIYGFTFPQLLVGGLSRAVGQPRQDSSFLNVDSI